MKFGLYISGIAHGALILWLLFGGLFTPQPEDDLLQVSQVSILSEAEFDALTNSAAEPESVAPEVSPAAPSRPVPPELAPEPEPAPLVQETAPTDIDRVAPEVAPEPAPEAEIAPVVQEEVTADEFGAETQPESQATAPEAATTEIVTEATEFADLAPAVSLRPRARPNRPAPTSEPEPISTPEPAVSETINDAIAEALTNPTRTPESVPSGPPLSRGELRGLQVSVGSCWNVGSLSSEAMQTTVVVGVTLSPEAKPEIASIHMVSFTGGSEVAARRAYETARRAIIRCGSGGYNLPSEKYEHWREIEMTFNPENMRIK